MLNLTNSNQWSLALKVFEKSWQTGRNPEKCLQVVLNDYSNYYKELIQAFASVSIDTRQLHAIGDGIFKTLDDLNPNFLKEIFYCPQNLTHRKCNIYVYSQNTKKIGNKNLSSVGAHI